MSQSETLNRYIQENLGFSADLASALLMKSADLAADSNWNNGESVSGSFFDQTALVKGLTKEDFEVFDDTLFKTSNDLRNNLSSSIGAGKADAFLEDAQAAVGYAWAARTKIDRLVENVVGAGNVNGAVEILKRESSGEIGGLNDSLKQYTRDLIEDAPLYKNAGAQGRAILDNVLDSHVYTDVAVPIPRPDPSVPVDLKP